MPSGTVKWFNDKKGFGLLKMTMAGMYLFTIQVSKDLVSRAYLRVKGLPLKLNKVIKDQMQLTSRRFNSLIQRQTELLIEI